MKTKNSKKHNLQYFEYQTKIFLQSSFKMFSQLWWNGLMEVYAVKTSTTVKNGNDSYSVGIGVIPIPMYVLSHSFSFPCGTLISIPSGFPWDFHSHWESHSYGHLYFPPLVAGLFHLLPLVPGTTLHLRIPSASLHSHLFSLSLQCKVPAAYSSVLSDTLLNHSSSSASSIFCHYHYARHY